MRLRTTQERSAEDEIEKVAATLGRNGAENQQPSLRVASP